MILNYKRNAVINKTLQNKVFFIVNKKKIHLYLFKVFSCKLEYRLIRQIYTYIYSFFSGLELLKGTFIFYIDVLLLLSVLSSPGHNKRYTAVTEIINNNNVALKLLSALVYYNF